MCLFTHIAAGAIAGALSPALYAAPFLGLAGHVVLDIIPHRDNQKIFPGHRKFLLHGMVAGRSSIGLQMAVSVAVIAFLIRRGV